MKLNFETTLVRNDATPFHRYSPDRSKTSLQLALEIALKLHINTLPGWGITLFYGPTPEISKKLHQHYWANTWISPGQMKKWEHLPLTAQCLYFPQLIEPCAQLQRIMTKSQSCVKPMSMVTNNDGLGEWPELLKWKHQSVLITS